MSSGRYESSDSNHIGRAITFLLIGIGAGALAALVLAPKTGKQFRRDLKRGYEDAKDTLQDWTEEAKDRARDAKERVRDVAERGANLADELREAGMGAEQAGLLTAAADRAGRWWSGTGGLPGQVIHGDLTPANFLADPGTGEVIGLLDFELAGAGFRVQDTMAALYYSTALTTPDWPRRTAAFLRGCSSVNRLEPAEVAALPELLIARSLGSVLWRAARWRAGLARFGDVIARVEKLEASTRWLAANEGTFLFVATAANAAP